MHTSAHIAATVREIRPTRHIGQDKRQTIRVRPPRGLARRAAINASLGYR